jgi:hypothetical protein
VVAEAIVLLVLTVVQVAAQVYKVQVLHSQAAPVLPDKVITVALLRQVRRGQVVQVAAQVQRELLVVTEV